MLKVLQVIEGLNAGGAETLLINLHRNIDRNQIQFDYIITNPSPNQDYMEEIKSLGGRIYVLPSFNGFNYLEIINSWNTFFKNHKDYLILHSHIRSYASLYLPIAKRYGLYTIVHSHSTSNGTGIKAALKGLLQFPLRYEADYYLSCSDKAGTWLFGNNIIEKKNYSILKNAIDTRKFGYNSSNRMRMRDLLSLNGCYTYIHVGRFHESKNHVFLINLFKLIHDSYPDTKLLLLGDGELFPEIQDLIVKEKLLDSVILVGSVENTYDYLQAADCFLFPSLWEGLGMSVIEAQASGLHCICSTNVPEEVDITGLCEFVPLESDYEWFCRACNRHTDRFDTSRSIIDSGYDIRETTLALTKIYYSIVS